MSDILAALDLALSRMVQRGHDTTPHYARLLAKRDAIAAGQAYQYQDIAETLIGGIARQIPRINRNTRGKLIVRAIDTPAPRPVARELWEVTSA